MNRSAGAVAASGEGAPAVEGCEETQPASSHTAAAAKVRLRIFMRHPTCGGRLASSRGGCLAAARASYRRRGRRRRWLGFRFGFRLGRGRFRRLAVASGLGSAVAAVGQIALLVAVFFEVGLVPTA